MGTPSASFSGVWILEYAAALLAEKNLTARARLAVQSLQAQLPDSDVIAYVLDGDTWKAKASAGDVKIETPELAADAGTLGALLEKKEVTVFQSSDLAREDYSHLNIRRSFQTVTLLPLVANEVVHGAVEVISYSESFTEENLSALGDWPEVTAIAFASAGEVDSENKRNLESIARLTELYDLQLVFSSTLEMDQLIPLITSKTQALAQSQAVNLWLVEGDSLLLVNTGGVDTTVESGTVLAEGKGIASEAAESGSPVLIDSPEDERLQSRNEGVEEGAIFSLMAVPLLDDGNCVGVLEAVNHMDGRPFDEDDVFLLNTISEAATIALHNASLMYAERKIQILETLVKLSTEITSTLNLERVLMAIVNGSQTIVPFERAAISLEHRGRLQLKAVSGEKELNMGSPAMKALQEMHEWIAMSDQELHVREREGEVESDRDETRAKFTTYFEQSGSHAFYALPLADDQGRVGVLSMESSDPDFLHEVHLEIIKVLAGQATVALRNAELYRDVPFIEVLEPILQKKQQFMRMQKSRRRAVVAMAVAVLVGLVVLPLPMRVEGTAIVAPQRTAQVQPEIEGVISKVNVREGDTVTRGTILAEMADWDYRAALSSAKAKQGISLTEMNRALARNDSAEAGRQRVEADYWTAEVARAEYRLDRTKLRSPIDGVVSTPYIDNFVGKHLDAGEPFGEVVSTRSATVDVAVDERDVAILDTGSPGAVKLDGFPTRTFKGNVGVISPKAQPQEDRRVVQVRLDVPNPDGAIRAGMQGNGKVMTGWRPAGYVFFRRPALWIWEKLWVWFGW